jgi:hypothetical protein
MRQRRPLDALIERDRSRSFGFALDFLKAIFTDYK